MNHSVHSIPRRHFLRAAGVSVALPFLPGLLRPAKGEERAIKRRFVTINLGLGFLASNFTPTKAGHDYEPSKYLQLIDEFRSQFTVISGTSHPTSMAAIMPSEHF